MTCIRARNKLHLSTLLYPTFLSRVTLQWHQTSVSGWLVHVQITQHIG